MKPFGLHVYHAMTQVLALAALVWLKHRAKTGKEDPARLAERLGITNAQRPKGPLIWLHGASVGEADLALNLIEALSRAHKGTQFLLTTGTRTSAEMVAARMGKHTRHQYLPLDISGPVQRFLTHWHPNVGIFMESELWPNLILAAKDSGLRLALVNARMNAWSLRRWQNVPASAAHLLGAFDWIGAADEQTRLCLTRLSKKHCIITGNLKLAAPPPKADAQTLARLRRYFKARKVWLALSTHKGEEDILMAAHQRVQKHHADAVLLLLPRHPERAASLVAIGKRYGFSLTRHSDKDMPKTPPDIYIGDSIGDMGLWLRLGSPAFIGGSLLSTLSGHNPIEAAKLKVPVLCGPYRASFARLYDDLYNAQGMVEIRDATAIADAVVRLWGDPKQAEAMTKAAYMLAQNNANAPLEMTLAALNPLIEGEG